MTDKIDRFLARSCPATPCLVIDVDRIVDNYRHLARALPQADIFYAMKANPAPEVLRALVAEGAKFDTASIYEIADVMACGARPRDLSFGNTIKKEADIASAYRRGVRLYAFDSEQELLKLARSAPGSQVFCRVLMTNPTAGWPTSRKFGCDVEMAASLLIRARDLGLVPYGVSFHVGSQQTELGQWDVAIGRTRVLFTALEEAGIRLEMVNLGGGMPARYRDDVPGTGDCARAILDALTRHFGNRQPRIIIEPGRSLAADAGIIAAEVVLISQKSAHDDRRWVYLDIGKFTGLPETMGEAIRYRIQTDRDGGKAGPVIIAGPTCDEVDVLYDQAGYELPLDLQVGDKVRILGTGAYTATYAAVGFNGFPPLAQHCI